MPLPENQIIMKSLSLQGTVFDEGTCFPWEIIFMLKKNKLEYLYIKEHLWNGGGGSWLSNVCGNGAKAQCFALPQVLSQGLTDAASPWCALHCLCKQALCELQ